MRTSVLTGLFACVIVFGLTSSKATALSQETTTGNLETSVVKLLAMETETALEVLDEVTEIPTQNPAPVVTKHTIVEGDTLSKIAEQYATTWLRIYSKNTTIENPDILTVGAEIIIPTSDEQLPERPLPVPVPEPIVVNTTKANTTKKISTKAATTTSRGTSSGNGYVAGYCTWYVKNRRPDLPNNLGNAATWVSRAAAQGIPTGSTPQVGAVGQRGNHVVYVESVNEDGTVTISEMNHKGRYVMTTRTLPANYFSYIY